MWIPSIDTLATGEDVFERVDELCENMTETERARVLSAIEANPDHYFFEVMDQYESSPHVESIREAVAALHREMAESVVKRAHSNSESE